MAIISENNHQTLHRYGSTQFHYAMTYVFITFFVLFFLNIYTAKTSQKLFYQSKEASMIEKCQLAASEISGLDVLNPTTVSAVISQMGVTHMIITDSSGTAIYDSLAGDSVVGETVLFPEIVKAMEGNGYNVFSWQYHDGAMQSNAATPVLSYGTLVGCVYIMEYDSDQGLLIQSLLGNILFITLVLELVVILFSIAYARTFSQRLRKIMASIRIIQEGDYSHKVSMGGHDELTVLGEEFNDLTDRLQVSEKKRHQFVSDASHELKTPLAAIKLLTDSILQNDMDIETIREFVGDIGSEADRLTRTSQKLLTLSRIDSQADGDCEIIYMAPTVKRVTRMLSAIAEKNAITIDLELNNDCPILILEDDLYQIVFNLVENGIKYNTPGGKLTVKLSQTDDNAVLEVSDTGVGIPEEAISHIFERFYRVDKARSRKSGGSGLGLSIVRNIVERNRGEIRVESTVGNGTTFMVIFPVFDTEVDSE